MWGKKVRQGLEFSKWLDKIKDRSIKIKLLARLARVENGNFGDHKNISQNLFELRFHFGPGYRIYYTIQNDVVVLLLAGGDKSSQKKDIKKALTMLR